jgi:ABC-type bacteriocin/lantibiotic exporter with double-glycine peptidase domain
MADDDYVIMRDLSFEIHQGEIFVIIEQSGGGKSTLVKYLLGLRHAGHQRIFYDGQDTNSVIKAQVLMARKYGY